MTWTVRRRAAAVLVTAVVAIGAAAVAVAFWISAGTGSGTAVLSSPQQLTLGPGTAQGQLVPGGASAVVAVATNPNPYFVDVGSLTLDATSGTGGFDVDAGHSGCAVSVLHLAAQDNDGSGWRVPPRVGSTDGTQVIELGGALTMDADAADACQGASFTVYLTAGA